MKANLKKTPLAEDLSLSDLAKITEGMSGADLTEICQQAAKVAIRQSIMADIQRKEKEKSGHIVDDVDPVPCVTIEHFNEALRNARKSNAKQDLYKYDEFRKK